MMKLPPIALHTDMNFVVCLQRLREAIDIDEIWAPFVFSKKARSRPVLGFVSRREFRIRKRRVPSKDVFGSYFWGIADESRGGTRIEGYYAAAPLLRKLNFVLLSFIFGLGGIAFVQVFRRLLEGRVSFEALVLRSSISLLFVLLPLFLRFIWRVQARRQEAFLIEFLEATLIARRDAKSLPGEVPK
jgi:hypothetical protein